MTSGLFATEYGESGRRVVFCHGLFGQGRNWTQMAKALAGDYRITLLDMPNHGRSEWMPEFSYLAAADRVAETISSEDPVALVGHSMGGKIAMLVALRHPHLVERLCVADIAPVDYERASEFSRYVSAMRGLDLSGLASRTDADAALTEAVPNQTVRSFLLQNLRRDGDQWRWQVNLEGIGAQLAELAGWPAAQVAGARYEGRTLWLAGSESDYVQDKDAAIMESYFPRVRRVKIKNAGHWLHSEQPDVFLATMQRFLAD